MLGSGKSGSRERGWKEVGEGKDTGDLVVGGDGEERLELKRVGVGEHEVGLPRRPPPLVSRYSNSLA